MPLLGLGTSQAQGDECETAVKKAIDLGYRVSHLPLWLFSLLHVPKKCLNVGIILWCCSKTSYLPCCCHACCECMLIYHAEHW